MMLRRLLLAAGIGFAALVGTGGCSSTPRKVVTPPPLDRSVVCAEQNLHRIVIFRADSDWSDPANLLWSWEPWSDPGIRPEHRDWFRHPSDCKAVFRNGEMILMTSASDGAVALLDVAGRRARFYAWVEGNPHSAELLPDGNLAVVSSTGNTLTLFAVPESMSTPFYDGKPAAEYPFRDAHGCVWDKEQKLLWVLGGNELAAFEYNFDKHAPALVKRESYRLDERRFLPAALREKFPANKRPHFYGHDLFPLPDSRALLLSGGRVVLRFDPVRRDFTIASERRNLKSVSVNPADGRLLFMRPTRSWWSDSLTLDDSGVYTLPGAKFYKGRWFSLNRFSY